MKASDDFRPFREAFFRQGYLVELNLGVEMEGGAKAIWLATMHWPRRKWNQGKIRAMAVNETAYGGLWCKKETNSMAMHRSSGNIGDRL